jgi:polar amino acid transport system ATP-binding protein
MAGIRKSYGAVEVLHGVNLTVRPGEVACLIGPSGSGKTTLLRCVNNLESIDSGAIRVDGKLVGVEVAGGHLRRVSEKSVATVRQEIGMVFQHFNLFGHMTAIENIVEAPIGVKKESRADAIAHAKELLQRVGMTEYAHSYARQLSGGQQQRVAIARALAMRPKVMLYDEPTSALDPELVGDVLEVIKDVVHENMTSIIVTHEIGFARQVADTVHFMDDGMIVESGPPDQMLEHPRELRTRNFLSKVLV